MTPNLNRSMSGNHQSPELHGQPQDHSFQFWNHAAKILTRMKLKMNQKCTMRKTFLESIITLLIWKRIAEPVLLRNPSSFPNNKFTLSILLFAASKTGWYLSRVFPVFNYIFLSKSATDNKVTNLNEIHLFIQTILKTNTNWKYLQSVTDWKNYPPNFPPRCLPFPLAPELPPLLPPVLPPWLFPRARMPSGFWKQWFQSWLDPWPWTWQ